MSNRILLVLLRCKKDYISIIEYGSNYGKI